MKEEIKELLRQREELSNKLERTKGTSFTKTRDAILVDIHSLDEVLKEFARITPPIDNQTI